MSRLPQEAVSVRLALVSALQALPRRQRAVIVLRYLADMSEDSVATTLGISRGSVKTHTRRGLDGLRRSFRDEGEAQLAVDR